MFAAQNDVCEKLEACTLGPLRAIRDRVDELELMVFGKSTKENKLQTLTDAVTELKQV